MTATPAFLTTVDGRTMALERVSATGNVRGLLLEFAIEQHYRNATGDNVEVVYTFPLPFDATLLDLELRLGERTLRGVVVERKAAEENYEVALVKGDTAVMLERGHDGLCTLNLGNLLAGETAMIRYSYAQLLRFNHGSIRIAVPTVIAPRYGDPAAAGLEAHQVPVTDVCVAYPFSLTLALEGEVAQGTLDSPSHPIAVERTDAGLIVKLSREGWLDRDFILDIGGLAGRSLASVVKDGDTQVVLASFVAPLPEESALAPLCVKLLVDRSGSMAGDSIAAAKRALHRVLESLLPVDRFSLSSFGSEVAHVQAALVKAVPGAVRLASQGVSGFDADLGGTEMEAALRAVFAIRANGTGAAADVLIITDGEIFGADALVTAARAAKQRVFAVGIGSAPAEGVLRALADATGGACEFVAPNEDAEAAILRMFARLRAPRIARVDLAWPQAPAWITPLPSGLFGGETIHVFAGFDAPVPGTVKLSLRPVGEGEPIEAEIALPAVAEAPALPRIAAARRIESANAEEALALAMRYGLLTDRTNLLVIAERAKGEKAQDLPALQQITQMHAAGWGGVGSVRDRHRLGKAAVLSASLDDSFVAYCCFLRDDSDDDIVLHFPATPSVEEERADSGASIDVFITRLARHVSSAASAGLPVSIADLVFLDLHWEHGMRLYEMVGDGVDEADVVRAFLEFLRQFVPADRKHRRLRRALGSLFGSPDDCRALRERIAAVFADLVVPAATG